MSKETMDTPSQEKLVQEFIQDVEVFTESILNSFNLIEQEIEKTMPDEQIIMENINQAFRDVHSLKSEASYLRYDTITSCANEIENEFSILRDKEKEISKDGISKLKEILDQLITTCTEKDFYTLEDVQPEGSGTDEVRNSPILLFDDFERKLLREARDRDEKIYRMVCEIDEAETMKYPRIYLVINNLELIVNVIKIIPGMDEIENSDFTEVVLYFTSSEDEKNIYNAVNIDQIKRIQISTLDFATLFASESTSYDNTYIQAVPIDQPYVRIDSSQVDDLIGYIDEMQFCLHRMGKSFNTFMQINTKEAYERLNSLIDNASALLQGFRLVPVSREFGRLRRLVKDVAEKLGKKVTISFSGGEIEIDRRLLDHLADPLFHLVRNAVDHGIEPPDIRREKGKSEEGTISVTVFTKEERLIFQISDDGNGIDKNDIIRRAEKMGMHYDEPREVDILSILSLPGFSTAEEMTDFSGRGVGLDLVSQKINKIENSSFHTDSTPGEGTIFTISLPKGYMMMSLLLTKSGDWTIAVPKRIVESTIPVDQGKFTRDNEGLLFYDMIPVYTRNGRVLMRDKFPEESYGVLLHYLGKRGCLLVDELFFEKEVPEDQIVLGEEVSPYIFRVTIHSRKTDYYFFNPAMIT